MLPFPQRIPIPVEQEYTSRQQDQRDKMLDGVILKIALFFLIEKAFFEYPDFAKAYVILLSEKIHFLNKKLSAFFQKFTVYRRYCYDHRHRGGYSLRRRRP